MPQSSSGHNFKSAEDLLYQEIWAAKLEREENLSEDGSLRTSAALPLFEQGIRFLDIGCGEGTLGQQVRHLFDEIHGVDISGTALDLARTRGITAHRVNLNTEPLPYEQGFFSAVASLDVIEHVFDPVRLVREIRRVLSPGGYAIVSTPNIRKIQRILTLIRGHFPRTSYDPVGFDGGHLHYFTSHDLANLLTHQGFTIETVDGICGDRQTWKYRLAVRILGRGFEKEFLSSAILIKARKKP
jgi:2-polyprenyl-3-methyl-5-hydroxy-6-metoxy-1,4-benzoquinol methylase